MDIKGLQQVKDYHLDAAKRLIQLAQDCDGKQPGIKVDGAYYRRRAALHAGLIDILDAAMQPRTGCPGHGRAECVTCCWPANALWSDRSGQIAGLTVVEDKSIPPDTFRICNCNQGRLPCTCK